MVDLESMSKEELIELIVKSRKKIDKYALEINDIVEKIPENHRSRFMITNLCMGLQGVCKELGEYYIDLDW